MGSKGKISTFSEHGHVHIKLKGMTNAPTCKHIFCPYTHTRPLGWDQRSKLFFLLGSSHVAYQINWNRAKSTMQAHILSYHTSSALGWVQNDLNGWLVWNRPPTFFCDCIHTLCLILIDNTNIGHFALRL